jgi:hypothetical protein
MSLILGLRPADPSALNLHRAVYCSGKLPPFANSLGRGSHGRTTGAAYVALFLTFAFTRALRLEHSPLRRRYAAKGDLYEGR